MKEDENQAPLPVQPPVRKNRRKRNIIIFVVVSLINVGLLALLWSQLLTPAQSTTSGQTTADPLIGRPAPAFTLAALNMPTGHSKLFSLNELKGKAVVINVWASWCVPCNQEAPMLQSAWKQLQASDKDVVFVGIDFQDSSKDALTFMHKYAIGYPNVLDSSGSVAIDYGVTAVPETIFINSKGTVVSTVRQELTAQALQKNLQLII